MIPIKSTGSWLGKGSDPKCFLFSLKTLTKYSLVDDTHTTYFANNYGPWFAAC